MATRMASGGRTTLMSLAQSLRLHLIVTEFWEDLMEKNHKRYRRDILLSLIGMHEKNNADAAKCYERFQRNLSQTITTLLRIMKTHLGSQI